MTGFKSRRQGASARTIAPPRRNLVDSSAWLEYFADGPNADLFAEAIEDRERLVVPTIVLLEVFRRTLQQRDEVTAIAISAQLRSGELVDLSPSLATEAASLGVAHRLPLADSVVYATARRHSCLVWTQDADFATLPDVVYHPHRKP